MTSTPEQERAAVVAKGLTKGQRTAEFYGVGWKRLPKVTMELHQLGLVHVTPMMAGWHWQPTDLGKAVREHLRDGGE